MCKENTINSKKTCNICNQVKPLDEFYKKPNGSVELRGHCKECHGKTCNTAEEAYVNKLKREYNMTLADYNNLMDKQGHKCANCGKEVRSCAKPKDENDTRAKAMVDHCHDSNEVRGILCNNCNIALGHLKDNVKNIVGLASYLLNSKVSCGK